MIDQIRLDGLRPTLRQTEVGVRGADVVGVTLDDHVALLAAF